MLDISRIVRTFNLLILAISGLSIVQLHAADTERLKKDVVPTFESINLKIDPRETTYGGNVSIALSVKNETNSFIFHAEEIMIVDLILSGKQGEIKTSTAAGENGRITLTADKPLAPGEYQLGISFTASYNTQAVGLYRTEVGEESYLFTQFEESDARKAFPCFDEPAFKFPYQITVTIPEENLAISNTPIEIEAGSEGWKTMTFKKTEPLPSYLLALAIGPLETVDVPNMPIPTRVVCVKGKGNLTEEAVKVAPPLLNALVAYFQRPYPYEKLDLIAVPEFWAGAMENAGAITFRETVLLLDPKTIAVSQKSNLVTTMAHEMSHMWFGDLVTMEWWDDLWLNESFASWMGDRISQQEFPNLGVGIGIVETGLFAMNGDALPTALAIRPPQSKTADLLGNIGAVYSKGQAVLLMIERWLGEESFQKGVLLYLKQNEWKNATAADLWKALSEASGKDVEKTLGTFIVQPGVPLVSVEMAGDNQIRLTQKRFANYGVTVPQDIQWEIPVAIKYFDGKETRQKTWEMTKTEELVNLESRGPIQWVFPNVNSAGYYRWHVPSNMLAKLLESPEKFLSVEERVGLLSNLAALLDAGETSGAEYLNSLSLFANDPDPSVIDNLTGGLRNIKSSFGTDNLKTEFAEYVNHLLKPALDRFGLEAKPGENENITLLRPSLINWLADEGQNEQVGSYLVTLAKKYLEDPASIDPSMAGVCIRAYAKTGDRSLFEDFKKRIESAQVPAVRSRFLYALGNFTDSALIQSALDYCLNGKLYPQEVLVIPFVISGQSEERDDLMLNWVMNNFDAIKARIPKPNLSRLAYFGSGCSAERLTKAKEFFSQADHKTEDTDMLLARMTASVGDCVGLREREGASVTNYLKKFASAGQ